MGHEQLVGIGLLFDERRSGLHAFPGIGDGAFQGRHTSPQAKGSDHQPGVAKYLLGLEHALALYTAQEVFHGDMYVLQGEGRGVGDTNAVLVLRLARCKALHALFEDEKGIAIGREGHDGVHVGDAAVGDELLVAVQTIADDPAILLDPIGARADGGQIAARCGFGDGIGHQQPLFGDARQPLGLLFRRASDQDRVQAKGGSQHRAGQAQVDAGQGF